MVCGGDDDDVAVTSNGDDDVDESSANALDAKQASLNPMPHILKPESPS